MIKRSKTINRCQISKKRDLIKILSLGYLPPVNNYHPINSIKNEEIFFPAELMYSKSSKLVQLGTIVDKEIIFPKSYPYTSSTTKILRDNFNEKGELLIFFLILIGISTDFGGYLFGKSFKGPKLTKISPNKTYSGVFCSYIVSIFSTYILLQNLPFFLELKINLNFNLVLLIFILSSISQFGDLVVSYFKRLSSLKDTGKIIPGHGGILDRIDGLIFIFPSFYILNLFLKII